VGWSDDVIVSQRDRVLEIRLNRPASKNALTDAMVATLIDVLGTARSDRQVGAICLIGAGDDFCSGFDLRDRPIAPDGEAGDRWRRLPAGAHQLVVELARFPLPVVAAVHGWAVGIGLHLALAADFLLVADDAQLWEPFLARGFTPDSGGSWLLPRALGMPRAKQVLLLGDPFSSTDAVEWGLALAAHPSAELAAEADRLARRLAERPSLAYGISKELLHEGASCTLESQLTREALALEVSARHPDFAEGRRAMQERRDPSYNRTGSA